MKLFLTGCIILAAAASAYAADINLKFTGISIDPQGTEGTDYVAERLWYDQDNDDDMVLYIRSDVDIAMYHNADNMQGKGNFADSLDQGDIWYKIDGDELAIGQKYHSYSGNVMRDPLIYGVIQFKYDETGPYDLAAFKGMADMDNGIPEYDDEHFHYGTTDGYGDEWHTITFWDDDSASSDGSRDASSSDGKVLCVVLDPLTPALKVTAPAGEEFYTSPPKTYYTPRIFAQTTWLTSGARISLYNLLNGEPVYYRVDGGAWTAYADTLTAADLFGTDDTVYDFEYRNGSGGSVRLRRVHYNPSQPAQDEVHPKLRFADEAELEAMRTKVHGGDAELTGWYNDYQQDYYQHLTEGGTYPRYDYRSGYRNLGLSFSSYYYFIRGVGDAVFANVFVGRMEDYDDTHMQQAKEGLLYLWTVDPLGCENRDGRYGGPCQEREMYSDGKCTVSPQLAYDLLFHYTTDNGYADGMTPIQHIKIRDNLASEAAHILKYPESEPSRFWQTGAYDNSSTRNVQLEQTLTALALAMPAYDSEYYGTSGADGVTPATHNYAPLPETPVAWMDLSDREYVRHPEDGSLFRYGALSKLFEEDGGYASHGRDPYIGMMMRRANDFLVARHNFDGHRYARFENYFRMAILTRYPFNGHLMPQGFYSGGYYERWDMGRLINGNFEDAGLYRWAMTFPDSAEWDDYVWADKSIAPEAPDRNAYVEDSWAVLSSDFADPRAVMMRQVTTACDMPYPAGTFIGYRPHFNICGYGERLAIEKAGYGHGDYDYLSGQKRRNTIVIDGEIDRNYEQPKAAFYNSLLTDDLDYFNMRTNTRTAADGCSYRTRQVTLDRHLYFPDRKFLVFCDRLVSGSGSHTYTWQLHGASGGNTAADAFVLDAANDAAAWTKTSGVKLIAAFATDVTLTDSTEYDYIDDNDERFIMADRTGENVNFLAVLYPVDDGQTDPAITPLTVTGADACRITDGDDNSAVTVQIQHDFDDLGTVTAGTMVTDGSVGLCREDSTGALTYCSVVNGTFLEFDGTERISVSHRMDFTCRADPGNDDANVVLSIKPEYGTAPDSVTITFRRLDAGTVYNISVNGFQHHAFTSTAQGEYVYRCGLSGEALADDDIVFTVSKNAGATESEPPAAPGNVTALAGNRRVFVAWEVSSSEGDYDFAGYNVYVSETGGSGYAPAESLVTGTATAVAGLTNGTDYYLVVKAVDIFGNESAASEEVRATPAPDDTPPAAPGALTALPGNGTVALYWKRSTDGNLGDFAGYTVYRSTTPGGGYASLNPDPVNGASYVDSTVINGTAYYYVITAGDVEGNESGYSPEAAATPQATLYGFPCHDDFEDGDYDRVDGNLENGLSWADVNSVTFGVSGGELRTSTDTDTTSYLACDFGRYWANYRVDLYLYSDYAAGRSGGLTVLYVDPDNHYFINIGEGKISRVVDGTESVLAGGDFGPPLRGGYDYRVTVNSGYDGIRIRVDRYADGYCELDYVDTDSVAVAALMHGTIGFRSNTDRAYRFDDVAVGAQNDPVSAAHDRGAVPARRAGASVTVTPHPVDDYAVFAFDRVPDAGYIAVYATDGALVDVLRLSGTQDRIRWRAPEREGMYLYVIVTAAGRETGRLMIVR